MVESDDESELSPYQETSDPEESSDEEIYEEIKEDKHYIDAFGEYAPRAIRDKTRQSIKFWSKQKRKW